MIFSTREIVVRTRNLSRLRNIPRYLEGRGTVISDVNFTSVTSGSMLTHFQGESTDYKETVGDHKETQHNYKWRKINRGETQWPLDTHDNNTGQPNKGKGM